MEAISAQELELASQKATGCVNECVRKYQREMKEAMDRVRDSLEFEKHHQKTSENVLSHFTSKCPPDTNSSESFLEKIKNEVGDAFQELKEIFELKRVARERVIKELLQECRVLYQQEMQNHFKDNVFQKEAQLNSLHSDTKRKVVQKLEEEKNSLNELQKSELDTEMIALFEKYKILNDMNQNSSSDSAAIGIHLGRRNCCVGVYWNGKVIIVPNLELGCDLKTPCYVTYHNDGSETVGKVAKENAYRDQQNTIYDVQRLLGVKTSDPQVQGQINLWPFTVQDDGGYPKILVNGKLLHPEQVVAKILRYVKTMTEKFLKLEPGVIKKSVITLPAGSCSDQQRTATVDAAELAGFEVLATVTEPEVETLAYFLERFDTNESGRKIVTFDFGGSSLCVAAVLMKHTNVKVVEFHQEDNFGGDDLDQRIVDFCVQEFRKKQGIDLIEGEDSLNVQTRNDVRKRLSRLRVYGEHAKIQLSTSKVTSISVDALINGVDFNMELTREKFEELNMTNFKKTMDAVKDLLQKASWSPDQIDDIILAGGSSRIPKVQEMLGEFFGGKALSKSINPEEAAAHGAAVKAAMIIGEELRCQK